MRRLAGPGRPRAPGHQMWRPAGPGPPRAPGARVGAGRAGATRSPFTTPTAACTPGGPRPCRRSHGRASP
eukprot:15024334-Alexandrium_andersonii.AAC.1